MYIRLSSILCVPEGCQLDSGRKLIILRKISAGRIIVITPSIKTIISRLFMHCAGCEIYCESPGAWDWSHAYISEWLKYFYARAFPGSPAGQLRLTINPWQNCALIRGVLFSPAIGLF